MKPKAFSVVEDQTRTESEQEFLEQVEEELNSLVSGMEAPGVREKLRMMAESLGFEFRDGSVYLDPRLCEDEEWQRRYEEYGRRMKELLRGGQN